MRPHLSGQFDEPYIIRKRGEINFKAIVHGDLILYQLIIYEKKNKRHSPNYPILVLAY